MTAEEYIAQGYRVTSRKHRTISRIDRSDWKEFLLEKYPNWVGVLSDTQIADHYRRIYSKDDLTVSVGIIKKMPNSGDLL